MKKGIVIILLSLSYCFPVFGFEFYSNFYPHLKESEIKQLKSIGFFIGDPSLNIILEKTDDYIVIQNSSVKSTSLEFNHSWNYKNDSNQKESIIIAPEVFLLEAEIHCNSLGIDKKYIKHYEPLTEDSLFVLCGTIQWFRLDPSFNQNKPLDSNDEHDNLLLASVVCVTRIHPITREMVEPVDWFKKRTGMTCEEARNKIEKKWPNINHQKVIDDEIRLGEFKDRMFILDLKKRVFYGDSSEIIPVASGTGFFVSSDGHIVTNNHVVDSCKEIELNYEGKSELLNTIAIDQINDLALLKSTSKTENFFTISEKDIELLEEVYVAGFPFGKEISSSVKVTKGVVSSLSGVGDNYSNMQIDAALQPGNSGGPIIDKKGNVVGVAVAKLDFTKVIEIFGAIPEDTNFGIKSSVLKTFLTSNNISLANASKKQININAIKELINNSTLYLGCWMTQAKIKELQSRKVMFTNIK